jgi:hypothetical protein
MWTDFADCPEQCPVSIAGDRFDLDTKSKQVLEVFFELLVPFPIAEPIELGEFDAVVPVQNQAQVIGEISAVNEQIYPFGRINTQHRRLLKIPFEKPLDRTPAQAGISHQLLKCTLSNYPLFKPNKPIVFGY